jgi:hypothetical protein
MAGQDRNSVEADRRSRRHIGDARPRRRSPGLPSPGSLAKPARFSGGQEISGAAVAIDGFRYQIDTITNIDPVGRLATVTKLDPALQHPVSQQLRPDHTEKKRSL